MSDELGTPWVDYNPLNGDVRCPNDQEFVNVRCWNCGWVRNR